VHDPVLTLKAMQKFAEKYCEITDTYFCSDLEIAATVVKGAWCGLMGLWSG
jgi:ferredoxin-thioredoxin reductase catalytic subunit